jgi:hypothetical protein
LSSLSLSLSILLLYSVAGGFSACILERRELRTCQNLLKTIIRAHLESLVSHQHTQHQSLGLLCSPFGAQWQMGCIKYGVNIGR